ENNTLSASAKAIDKATKNIKSFVESIVDAESFVETDVFLTGKSFDDAQEALGEGVVTGYATLGGNPVHIFAQNADVLKGSLSEAHANKIYKCMQRAIKAGTPLISVIDSCGARVGEGASVMEGYAKLIAGGFEIADEVPHICIVKGVAVGMMATFVAGADFVFMSKDAVMSVNSPMYLVSDAKSFPVDYKAKLGYKAYEGNSDVAQFVFNDAKDLAKQLQKLTSVLLSDEADATDDPNRVNPNLEKKISAKQRTELIFDQKSVVEYCPEYAAEVVCSLAKLNGISVGVIATEGDYISIEGLDKANSFVEKLEAYNIPLVTLVDSLGVNSTLEQEVKGFAKRTNALMKTIATSTIAKIGVAVGNAVGYAYSALMSKAIGFDYTLATSNAVVAPVGMQVSKVIATDQIKELKKTAKELEQKSDVDTDALAKAMAYFQKVMDNIAIKGKSEEEVYAQMQSNPLVAAKDGYIDNVIETTNLRPYLASALLMVLGI
ncbi:MAG: hypothetical protein K2L61_04650, partial [Clostridia bacterium]|nr:hypothetical protein [Clostridia bacterium]